MNARELLPEEDDVTAISRKCFFGRGDGWGTFRMGDTEKEMPVSKYKIGG